MLPFPTDDIPQSLHEPLSRFSEDWDDSAPRDCHRRLTQLLSTQPSLAGQLARVVIGSEFAAGCILAHPEVFLDMLEELPGLQVHMDEATLRERLARALHRGSDGDFDDSLREFRNTFMLRVIWRDLNRLANLEQSTAELSILAEAALQETLDYHYSALARQRGLPLGESSGTPQPLLILGMGKLGARELNLSSDTDLIFCYPESGETRGARRGVSNQEFFIRLGQKVIQSLDAATPRGFVFRVDMRLRPYGNSGALTSSFDALENYYQTQGREWERYAMIKARVVAVTGDAVTQSLPGELGVAAEDPAPAQNHAAALMELLRPFTYRRYLDYSAIEALRGMKRLITREVARKGLRDDVKLGAGGIREVEFIVQAFQLIRGGRDPRFRERRVLRLLPLLAESRCLPESVDHELARAYCFLRNTEHLLQAYRDRQTQRLPSDDGDRRRLAWLAGFESWEQFVAALDRHRQLVHDQFGHVVADPEEKEEEAGTEEAEWQLLWHGSLTGRAAADFLEEQGLGAADEIVNQLEALRQARPIMAMQATARERLDQLMPALLADLREPEQGALALGRVRPVLEAIARRSAYLVLLLENPPARRQLVKLCAGSPWIARQLAEHPVLLDELLDARTLYSPPDLDTLRDELRRDMLRLPWDDLEAQMEALRYFRLSHGLRVAACEVTGILPLMKVSDYLTYLAEVILQHVLELAWRQLIGRHGCPTRADGTLCSVDPAEGDFIIIGYGKLGGIELGHGSDLDLVFIHRADPALHTQGPRQVDNNTFFMRLGQKVIHILNTQTVSGQLYEIDMRLRPSGNSGLLVSSLEAFAKYQERDAWTWEHQALVRARVVAGSASLAAQFQSLRHEVLCGRRDLDTLRDHVVDMREKMRKHLGSRTGERGFHIKQDGGGIVDIEFMVQYAVLAWAHSHPMLTRYTDNIRILGSLADAGIMSPGDADALIDAYKTYRSTVHRLALEGLPSEVAGDAFQSQRRVVREHWQRLFG